MLKLCFLTRSAILLELVRLTLFRSPHTQTLQVYPARTSQDCDYAPQEVWLQEGRINRVVNENNYSLICSGRTANLCRPPTASLYGTTGR